MGHVILTALIAVLIDQVNLDSSTKNGGQILVGISINYNYRGPRKVMVNRLYPEHGPFLGLFLPLLPKYHNSRTVHRTEPVDPSN